MLRVLLVPLLIFCAICMEDTRSINVRDKRGDLYLLKEREFRVTAKDRMILYIDSSPITLLYGRSWRLPDVIYLPENIRTIGVEVHARNSSLVKGGLLASSFDGFLNTNKRWLCSGLHKLRPGFSIFDLKPAKEIAKNSGKLQVPLISSEAKWIWTEDNYSPSVYCHFDIADHIKEMSGKRTDSSSVSLYSSSMFPYSSSVSLHSSSASPYSSSASPYLSSASPYSSSASPYSSSASPYSSSASSYSSSASPYSSSASPYSSSTSPYSSSGSLYSSSISPYSSPVSQFALLTSTRQQTFQNTTEGFVQEHSKSVSVVYIESTEEQTSSSPIEAKTEETETITETKWIITTRDVTFASSPPFELTEQVPATTPKVDITEETYFSETTTTSLPTSIYKDIQREMWIASVEDLALYLDGVMISTHEFQPPSSPYHVTIPRDTSLLAVHAVNIDSHTIGIISTSANQNYVTDKRWKCTRVNPGPNWEEPGFDDSDWPIADMIIKNANCSIKSTSFAQQPDSKTQSSNQESETEFRPDDEDNSVVSRASFPCIPSISREAWWISCANFHCKSVCEMFCRVRFNSFDVGKTESSVKTCDC